MRDSLIDFIIVRVGNIRWQILGMPRLDQYPHRPRYDTCEEAERLVKHQEGGNTENSLRWKSLVN